MVVGILIGIAFYAAGQTLLHSGTVYGLSPFLTNFLPTSVLALATAVALARVR
jgi:lipopolysaccharide export LptBFGC system permease protein LptF